MLQVTIIGHIGADAEVKNANGKEFTTLRVAHTDKWTDGNGVSHEQTIWVDVILQGKPAVLPYLQRGQLVYISGSATLRVYSSPKDRCMKAGLTINARSVELLGGKGDDVPGSLVNPVDGSVHAVTKHFYCADIASDTTHDGDTILTSNSGAQFVCDVNGWVSRLPAQ